MSADRPGDLAAPDGGNPRYRVEGVCARPVRLVGHVDAVDVVTGEMRRTVDTGELPDGVLHVACRNRRAAVCPACSQTYRRDARRIVLEGLAGKAARPALFVTVTAPSFGPVHSRRLRPDGGPARACHPRRGLCVHGRPAGCHQRHSDDDRLLGSPLCPDCFDYAGAVVWNALAARLWARTRDRAERTLARLGGLTLTRLRATVRLASARVAEMQARGLVHFHAAVRLDGPDGGPPPAWVTVAVFEDAIRQAIGDAAVPAPVLLRVGQTSLHEVDLLGPAVRWGRQVDVRPVNADRWERVAGYLAKYVTKSTDQAGLLHRPVRSLAQLHRLGLARHPLRLVETCWTLGHDGRGAAAVDHAAGRRPGGGGPSGLTRWAHAYGYCGHWLAKSRGYSTTFAAVRGERRDHARAAQTGGRDPWGRPDHDQRTVTLADWRYAGTGHAGNDPGGGTR